MHCLCCTKLAFLTCWIHYIFVVFNPASITCRIHCIFAVFNPACMYPLSFTCLILCLRCIQTWLSHVLNTLLLRCVQPGLHMGYINTYYIILLFRSIGSPTSPCVNLVPLFCSRGVTYMILPDTSIMFYCVISWYNTEHWTPKQCIQHMGNHIWIPRRRSIRHVNAIGHMLTGLDTAQIQCVRHMIKTSGIQQRCDVSNTWEKQVWYGESNISDTGKITYM